MLLFVENYTARTEYRLFPWNIYHDGSYLGHKINLNKFKTMKIIQNVSSSHSGFKVEINNREITGKSPSPESKDAFK